jgi:hypothetical protein
MKKYKSTNKDLQNTTHETTKDRVTRTPLKTDFNNRIMDIEEFEDNKGGIRIHISKKNRQHNDQK